MTYILYTTQNTVYINIWPWYTHSCVSGSEVGAEEDVAVVDDDDDDCGPLAVDEDDAGGETGAYIDGI